MKAEGEILFRFLPAKWGIRALVEGRLRIGRIADFNDPFEGLLGDDCNFPHPHEELLRSIPKNLRGLADANYGVLSLAAIKNPADHPLM
jgi:hypothetical protein